MSPLKALGGTSDILPEEAERWQQLETTARSLFRLYGFREVRTPILEEAELFHRSLGAHAEVVNKQMYAFTDRGNRHIALRPEGTAPVVRALIEKGLDKTGGLTRWYYLGPMFRAERPQAGRRRQFHQIGVEVFGSSAPYQDAEVILLLRDLLVRVGLTGFQIKLNSLGCKVDRAAMIKQIVATFTPMKGTLCGDCQSRLKNNPLRILDCKESTCVSQKQRVDVSQSVCSDCREHFTAVLEGLSAAGLKEGKDYLLDRSLVRGLDYYTKTAFEVVHSDLGAQNALGGGGRYDDLVGGLGGSKATASIGWAIGVERVLMVLQAQSKTAVPQTGPQVYVAAIGKESLPEGFHLLNTLRASGIRGIADYESRPLKRQLEQANKLGCRLVIMLGDTERAEKAVTLKDLTSGKQEQVKRSALLERIKQDLQS